MVDRVLWGQEQFGGGFCGAGAEAASDVNPLTRKGLRTLGTYHCLYNTVITHAGTIAMDFKLTEL